MVAVVVVSSAALVRLRELRSEFCYFAIRFNFELLELVQLLRNGCLFLRELLLSCRGL